MSYQQTPYDTEAQTQWSHAHRRALWSRLLDNVKGNANRLIDFNDVSKRLNLKNVVYRELQVIPLDHIVGSVGRYSDFTRAFLPVRDNMEERWRAVASIQLDPISRGLPPIQVYKVRDWYFVKDGNHRVSVRRQLGDVDIEAYVWEYTDPLPQVTPEMDIDTFLIEAERMDFFQHTNLDTVRPGHNIHLSRPGGYMEMLYRIATYQDALRIIDGTDIPYHEAVTAWYDMIYETSIQIIEHDGILQQFPGYTVADLFVWLMHHHDQLAECLGHVHLEDAIVDLKRQHANPLVRMWTSLRRTLAR
jgi:hypothetical protein